MTKNWPKVRCTHFSKLLKFSKSNYVMEDLTILNEVHHFNNPDIQLDKDKTVSVYLICLAIDIYFFI